MQSHSIESFQNPSVLRPFRFHRQTSSRFCDSLPFLSDGSFSRVSCSCNDGKRRPRVGGQKQKGVGESIKVKKKENVWSIDNELAQAKERDNPNRRRRRGKRVRNVSKRNTDARVLVSAAMLMEIETVLETQEPVIKPVWNTFASSVSGIWKGVGAVFSPFTAELEPIGIGKQHENLYDCYTLSCIEQVPSLSQGLTSQIRRKINWVAVNPYGEFQQQTGGTTGDGILSDKELYDPISASRSLPSYESFDLGAGEVMEEDLMGMEPGLVFFEDGSYSRGPVDIPVGEFDESKYFLSPTFKFEQCLVKGCHKRLRIVHTIEFSQGGSDVQVVRIAVYEEKWVCPTNVQDQSDVEFDLKPFSQRKRTQPSELTGSWKVFETSATPIFGEETTLEGGSLPYVFLCTENLKKRNLPENPVYFGEEEVMDMQDVSVLWLPGGVTGYVDVKKDGILCVGVGWYSDEGINLVMERDYGTDGRLKEVRCKTEVKRRWSDPIPL